MISWYKRVNVKSTLILNLYKNFSRIGAKCAKPCIMVRGIPPRWCSGTSLHGRADEREFKSELNGNIQLLLDHIVLGKPFLSTCLHNRDFNRLPVLTSHPYKFVAHCSTTRIMLESLFRQHSHVVQEDTKPLTKTGLGELSL
jgi:hypothetical protein